MFSLTPTSEACIGNSRVLRFETKVKLLLHPQRVEELRESNSGRAGKNPLSVALAMLRILPPNLG